MYFPNIKNKKNADVTLNLYFILDCYFHILNDKS